MAAIGRYHWVSLLLMIETGELSEGDGQIYAKQPAFDIGSVL